MDGAFKVMFLIFFAASGFCATAAVAESSGNHEFAEVRLGYSSGDMCSFQYAPVYFCDDRHVEAIKFALKTKRADFDRNFIILPILERSEYYQKSLVAIDVRTGIAYPLPFDFYSGNIDAKGNVHNYGRVSYSIDSNRICVIGSIVAHRQVDSGKLCWDFDGSKFIGHETPYMD